MNQEVLIPETPFRATIEYDGTDLLGFQYQNQGRTVQGEIEKVLQRLTQSPVRIVGAGRTGLCVKRCKTFSISP